MPVRPSGLRPDGHTGVMATRNTLSTRWVTLIMVAALVCSVAVVWGLIQITGESPASSSTAPASESAGQSVVDTGTGGTSSGWHDIDCSGIKFAATVGRFGGRRRR